MNRKHEQHVKRRRWHRLVTKSIHSHCHYGPTGGHRSVYAMNVPTAFMAFMFVKSRGKDNHVSSTNFTACHLHRQLNMTWVFEER
jgi:hypothetical protein